MNELSIRDNEFSMAVEDLEFTKTGLIFHSDIGYKNWLLLGERLGNIESAIGWCIGDWLNEGEFRYGEMYAQAIDERQADTWRTYKWVASAVPRSMRVDNLSWTHHREVAPLPPAEQKQWLETAEREGLSTRELRAAIRQEVLENPVIMPSLRDLYLTVRAICDREEDKCPNRGIKAVKGFLVGACDNVDFDVLYEEYKEARMA